MPPSPEAIAQQVERARKLLARLLRVAGLTQAEADRRLEQRGLTNRILSGKNDLKFEHILLILSAAGLSPAEFFEILYADPGHLPSTGTLGGLLAKLAFDADDEPLPAELQPPPPHPDAGTDAEGERLTRIVAEAVANALQQLANLPPRQP